MILINFFSVFESTKLKEFDEKTALFPKKN